MEQWHDVKGFEGIYKVSSLDKNYYLQEWRKTSDQRQNA